MELNKESVSIEGNLKENKLRKQEERTMSSKKANKIYCVLAMVMVLVLSTVMTANAYTTYTVKGSTTKKTAGGSGGSVTIKSDVYLGYTYVYSGAHVYTFGVTSYIQNADESSNLITNFTLSGNMYDDDSSTPFSKNASNVNSIDYSESTQWSDLYSLCTSKTVTYSSAFGHSTQECNYSYE